MNLKIVTTFLASVAMIYYIGHLAVAQIDSKKLTPVNNTQNSQLTDAPHPGAAPIVELGPDGCTKNCTLNSNIRFIIISLRDDPEVPTSDDDTFDLFYRTQAAYDQVFGNGSVQIINGSKSTVNSLHDFLTSSPNNNLIAGQVQFLWIVSNHGYKNSVGGPTQLYWGCTESSCKQIANLKDFENIALSQNPTQPFAMAWFDACYTHVPIDGIASVVDGTAAGWIHLYNKEAYACGFTNYTNNFDTDYTYCIFNNALSKGYFKPGLSNSLTADQYNTLISTCHNDPSSAPVGKIAFAAPYCTSTNTADLPFGTFKSVRIVNNITGATTTAVLINSQDPDKNLVLKPSSMEEPNVIDAQTFYSLIDQTTLNNAIQNNTLNELLKNIIVKDLTTNKTANCVDTLDQPGIPPIKFDSQFNGFNISIGSTQNGPYCEIDYGYIDSSQLSKEQQLKARPSPRTQ